MTATEQTYTVATLVRGGRTGPWHAVQTGAPIPGQAMCGSRMTGFNSRQVHGVAAATFLDGSLTDRQCSACKTAVKAGRPKAYRS